MNSTVFPTLLLLAVSANAQSNLPNSPHIYVHGTGEIEVMPDVMMIQGNIESVAPTVEEATEALESTVVRFIKTAVDRDIPRKNIHSTTLRMTPEIEYAQRERRHVGFRVSRQVRLLVPKNDTNYQTMQALLESDTLTSVSSTYIVSDPEPYLQEAQLAAINDARLRAKKMAAQSGMEIGKVYSISEFNFREMEERMLTPSTTLITRSSTHYVNELDAIQVTGGRGIPDGFGGSAPPFEVENQIARAEVFVVFLLED